MFRNSVLTSILLSNLVAGSHLEAQSPAQEEDKGSRIEVVEPDNREPVVGSFQISDTDGVDVQFEGDGDRDRPTGITVLQEGKDHVTGHLDRSEYVSKLVIDRNKERAVGRVEKRADVGTNYSSLILIEKDRRTGRYTVSRILKYGWLSRSKASKVWIWDIEIGANSELKVNYAVEEFDNEGRSKGSAEEFWKAENIAKLRREKLPTEPKGGSGKK